MNPAVFFTAFLTLTFLLNLSESAPVDNTPHEENDQECYKKSVTVFYAESFKIEPSTEDDDDKLQKQITLCTNPAINQFPLEREFCRILLKLSKQICQYDLITLAQKNVVKQADSCNKFKLVNGSFKSELFIQSVIESVKFCNFLCEKNTILCEYFLWGNTLREAASKQSRPEKKGGKKSEETNPSNHKIPSNTTPSSNVVIAKETTVKDISTTAQADKNDKSDPLAKDSEKSKTPNTGQEPKKTKEVSSAMQHQQSIQNKDVPSSKIEDLPSDPASAPDTRQPAEGVPTPGNKEADEQSKSALDARQRAETGNEDVSIPDTKEADEQSGIVATMAKSEQPNEKDATKKDITSEKEPSVADSSGTQHGETNDAKSQKALPSIAPKSKPKPVEEETPDIKITTSSAGGKKVPQIDKANGNVPQTVQTVSATDKKIDLPQELHATKKQGSKTAADDKPENPDEVQKRPVAGDKPENPDEVQKRPVADDKPENPDEVQKRPAADDKPENPDEVQKRPEIDDENADGLEIDGSDGLAGEASTEGIKSNTTPAASTSVVAKEGESSKVPLELGDNKQPKDTMLMVHPEDKFLDEAEESHFFAYFLTAITLCILGYVAFHNKQKILAMVIEGRHQRRGRRSNGGNYRRLDNNLADVMEGIKSGNSPHIIY